ncbi:hypothetical protein [Nocardia camponoti]|uniref:Uncharacterized protein n=1 Tax=Nocardia camponoti TaxID=1616106 RepID=A0A917QPK2_9NOCA|nr:hypothetical protein [Nocardia camponoti]GGK62021.1 hypothetical protein GCM10011591_37830 [Nocardia camponoti]
MSIILTSVAETVTVYAQVGNPTPEAPPLADKIMQMVQYVTWFAMLSGILAITVAGGKLAWEKITGSAMESPKMIAGAMIGGVVATSGGTIMNAILNR